MSSSVTIDWRAVREEERRSQALSRAEVARLAERERHLRRRRAVMSGLHNVAVEVPAVRMPRGEVSSAELASFVARTRAGLDAAERALDQALAPVTREYTRGAPAAQTWSLRAGHDAGASSRVAYDASADHAATRAAAVARAAGPAPAELKAEQDAKHQSAAREADAVLEACRMRAPDTDIAELVEVRAQLGTGAADDRVVLQDLRYRAAQVIRRARRLEALDQERQRLLALVAHEPPGSAQALRRRVQSAGPGELAQLEQEIVAMLDEASSRRARADALEALHASLSELGYTVGEAFDTLLPNHGGPSQAVVVASPHSADHGVRLRADQDHVYLSVVRRAGTGNGDESVLAADREVQERTCGDLEAAVTAPQTLGVELVLGNEQLPGRRAPEMAATAWPDIAEHTESKKAMDDDERAAARHLWAARQRPQQTSRPAPQHGRRT